MKKIELHQPDPDVVERLEQILDRAKQGEIRGFILVADIQGGSSWLANAGEYHRPVMVGQLELLKARVIYEWMNSGEETDEDG